MRTLAKIELSSLLINCQYCIFQSHLLLPVPPLNKLSTMAPKCKTCGEELLNGTFIKTAQGYWHKYDTR